MSLADQMRAKIAELADKRAERKAELDTVHAAVEARGDTNLTADETAQTAEIRKAIAELDAQRVDAEARLAELEEDERSAKAAEEAANRFEPKATNKPHAPRVTAREVSPYGKENRGVSFFSDAYSAGRSGSIDFDAMDRLRRHAASTAEVRTETRDVGTSAFGGLVVPQYLVDEYAENLKNGRAFLNACRRPPLTEEGMAIIIPRGTTSTAVDAQASENAGVQETDYDETDLTINVRTFSGQQDVSRQSLERGTSVDAIIYADLVADYAAKVDASALAGAGTSGTHLGVLATAGINAVTYTDASPTVAEIWPKIASAVAQVGSNRKLPANMIAMHSTRWAWFLAALDTANRPLIINGNPEAGFNAMGVDRAEFGEGQIVGTLQGLPVLIDNNIPVNLGVGTDEDRIIVCRRQDNIVWEEGDGMPRELRFEEVGGGSLTVKLVVYGYSAFTAGRFPTANSVISGTGLVAPSL